MAADSDFVLLFSPARERDVLAALLERVELPPRDDGHREEDGLAVTLRVPATPELDATLARHPTAGAVRREGEVLLGYVILHRRLTEAPFGGRDHGLVLELTLWPVTTNLWHVCSESDAVRALLVDLLLRFEGIEGWVDHGDGTGHQFWPPP